MVWDLDNVWADDWNVAAPMDSYKAVMPEIHVLLVEHDENSLLRTAELLEMCGYRVTIVELASSALAMLISGKVKFDAVVADINSPDLHGLKLLQQAVSMSLPTLMMSAEDDEATAVRALQIGAVLYIRKPITLEILKSLWQHVLREQIRARRQAESSNHGRLMGAKNPNLNLNLNLRHYSCRNNGDNNVEQNYRRRAMSNVGININGVKNPEIIIVDQDQDAARPHGMKRKMCTEWNQELHQKFMDAVYQLGEGKCFPKDILQIMNVPGLTRMQVASHLQKCRNYKWRLPKDRRGQQPTGVAIIEDRSQEDNKPRKFGCMPKLEINDLPQQATSGGSSSGSGGGIEMEEHGGVKVTVQEAAVGMEDLLADSEQPGDPDPAPGAY
ncbi:two-component response regulator ARR2-like [Andrographis paniculata]|uniref:two-component response regulator ARR2-like n=1 Tax=Andrographis paniculata TaxID=175694 RepID=UPI0021E7C4FC|nr:two-component response regulator ARR2-like [Andrographis paniculata]